MSLHLRENAYRGVNAHLHSHFQQNGDWSVFHSAHIQDLRLALQSALPPETGYFVLAERSLQVVRDDQTAAQSTRTRTIPDISIYKGSASQAPKTQPADAIPTTTLALADTLVHEEEVMAVVVYRAGAEDDVPVARIELLSPANKPPGSHAPQYRRSRADVLYAGINMVEIDHLHERRSPLAVLPDYTKAEADAYPYLITISLPHPSAIEGRLDVFGFRVDDAIPMINVPLDGDNRVALDLNAVYQQTFANNPYFGLRLVDYAALPANFDAYDAEDQHRIRARMAQIAEEQS